MHKSALTVIAVGVTAALITSACGSNKKTPSGGSTSGSTGGSSIKGKVGVILPDTQSSARYESFDRPLLEAAFKAAGVDYDIQNAQGDTTRFASIADGMIQKGVSVLIVDSLDNASGAAVEQKAKAAGLKTIDYDRLTLGGTSDYYVSFDNVKVGELQGQGLVDCLKDKSSAQIIEINGSPDDNNATLFKQGYDSVLDKKYTSGWKKVGDKSTAKWAPATAATNFEQLLSANSGKVDGVLSANDDMAQAIITVLKKNGLKVPITGQDATVAGLQSVLAGDQCMTVYKPIKTEAEAAARLAISLLKGEKADTNGTVKDTTANRDVPSVLGIPVAITKTNAKQVVDDGFVTKDKLCADKFAALCTAAGIS
jgi:D-xylose transport system substrate-binding protein